MNKKLKSTEDYQLRLLSLGYLHLLFFLYKHFECGFLIILLSIMQKRYLVLFL